MNVGYLHVSCRQKEQKRQTSYSVRTSPPRRMECMCVNEFCDVLCGLVVTKETLCPWSASKRVAWRQQVLCAPRMHIVQCSSDSITCLFCSSKGRQRVLDVIPKSIHERTPIYLGCRFDWASPPRCVMMSNNPTFACISIATRRDVEEIIRLHKVHDDLHDVSFRPMQLCSASVWRYWLLGETGSKRKQKGATWERNNSNCWIGALNEVLTHRHIMWDLGIGNITL